MLKICWYLYVKDILVFACQKYFGICMLKIFWYLYVKDIYVTALGLVTWFIAKLNGHIFHVKAKHLFS